MKHAIPTLPTDMLIPVSLIRSNPCWKEIYNYVKQGEYVKFLGPRFSGKTQILKDVLGTLQKEGNHLCVMISFENWHIYERRQFYAKIAELITTALREAAIVIEKPLPTVRESGAFYEYLLELARSVPGYTCVIAITHLESIPRYLARILLRSLRKVYSERFKHAEFERIVVVAAGALNLFDLSATHTKTSPFNIAKLVILSEASNFESRQLIKQYGERVGVSYSDHVTEWIINDTRGDRYIIEMLCRLTCQAALGSNPECKKVTYWAAERVLNTLILDGDVQDAGLKERLRIVESDSTILKILLEILSGQNVQRRRLLTDIDALELTGFFRFEKNHYTFRNPLSEHLLRRYFTGFRAANRLSLLGYWEDAVSYFEKLDFLQLALIRKEYLTALINQMYTVDDEKVIFEKIPNALRCGFQIKWFNLFCFDDKKGKLIPVSQQGSKEAALPIPITVYDLNEQIESRAVIDNEFLLEEDSQGISVLALPISPAIGSYTDSPNKITIGLVTIYAQYPVDQFERFREEIWEITGFLNRVSQVILQIRERYKLLQRERQQLALVKSLFTVMNAISSELDLDVLLKMIANSIRKVQRADLISLYLYDEETKTFSSTISLGTYKSDEEFANSAIPLSNGLIAPELFRSKKVKVFDSDDLRKFPIPSKAKILSSAASPLLIANKPIGILFVNYRSLHSFDEDETQVIKLFADQAAIAIQNARLYASEARRAHQLRAISEVATQMRIEDNPQTILRLALTVVTCGEGLGFSRAMYFELNEEGTRLQGKLAIGGLTKEEALNNWLYSKGTNLNDNLLAVRSWPNGAFGELDRELREIQIPVEEKEGAPAESILKQKSILVKNAVKDPKTNLAIARRLFSTAFATVPLIVKDRPMGVLVIDQRYLPHPLVENDLPMVETLANLAAIAIENARLIRRMEGFGEIAHQLRSPLTDIRGRVQLMADKVITDPQKIQKYYQVILNAMEIFESNINQMLSLQKIEAGYYEFYLKETSVNAILQRAMDANRYGAAQKEITIEVHFKHDHDLIIADGDKLASSVQALLENAIKFSYKNNSVQIDTQEIDSDIYISITDHGRGINIEDIPHLGERHYRGKIAREERIDGIGLGLRIVKYVVEGHHGALGIESTPGKGSTFVIRIPQHGGG